MNRSDLTRLQALEAQANISGLEPPEIWTCLRGRCRRFMSDESSISLEELKAREQLLGDKRVIALVRYTDEEDDGPDDDEDNTAPQIAEGQP